MTTSSPSITQRYIFVLSRFKWALLVFGVGFVAFSAAFAPRLLTSTSNAYVPPDDTRAAHADRQLKLVFPRLADSAQLGLYVAPKHPDPATPIASDTSLRDFQIALNATAQDWDHDPGFVLSFYGYWLAIEEHVAEPIASQAFIAPDGNSTLMAMTIAASITDDKSVSYATYLRSSIDRHAHLAANYTIELTGVPAFVDDVEDAVIHDLETMDSIALPITFIVLAYVVESLRLLIIPLMCIGASAALSFAGVYVVAEHMLVLSFVPSFMMSLLIALCIDYGLFLMTRYREALLGGDDPQAAVETMLKSAGHTILVSGSTLAVCFLGLTAFNLEMLRAVGVGCSVTIIIIIAVNLSLSPLLLLSFPSFFAKSAQYSPYWPPSNMCRSRPNQKNLSTDDNSLYKSAAAAAAGATGSTSGSASARSSSPASSEYNTTSDAPASDDDGSSSASSASSSSSSSSSSDDDGSSSDSDTEDVPLLDSSINAFLLPKSMSSVQSFPSPSLRHTPPPEVRRLKKSAWWRFSSYLLRCPYNVLLLLSILAATMPFCLHALGVTRSSSMTFLMPRGASSTEALNKLTTSFSYGVVFPMSILIQPPAGVDVLGTEFTSNVNTTVSTMVNAHGLKGAIVPTDFESIVFNPLLSELFMDDIPAFAAEMAHCVHTPTDIDFPCPFVRIVAEQTLNRAEDAILLKLLCRFDPLAAGGGAFLSDLRAVIDAEVARTGYSMSVSGAPPDFLDAVTSVYDAAPIMCGVSVLVMLVFVGVAFKSVFLPLRSVMSISLTLGFVYGFAVLTYQHGMLNWMGVPGLHQTAMSSQFWLVPVLSFPVIIGISLDYDIFLLDRIREYRAMGYSTKMSIRMGLTSTGKIINAAGICMAIAFCVLCASHTPLMCILGLYLVVAVLFDTFVCRTIVVPAIMSLVGELSWFPGNVPTPFLYDEEAEQKALEDTTKASGGGMGVFTKPRGRRGRGGGGGRRRQDVFIPGDRLLLAPVSNDDVV